jgi:hypothetical protein
MPSSSPPPRPAASEQLARRPLGPRIAAVGFLGFVIPWVFYISAQIVVQVLWPDVVPSPWAGCSEGRRGLAASLERAAREAEENDDPDEALRRFRTSISTDWRHVEGVRTTCSTPDDRRALDALERLRYAEENAVRREVSSLARLRREVSATLGVGADVIGPTNAGALASTASTATGAPAGPPSSAGPAPAQPPGDGPIRP